MIRGLIHLVGNGDSYLLPLSKQERFQRMEDRLSMPLV